MPDEFGDGLTIDDLAEDLPKTDAEDEADEFAVVLEGEEAPPVAPGADSSLLRTLRAELKATKAELAANRKVVTPPKVLGPKPTFEEHNFDPDAYDTALLKWNADKAEIEGAQQRAEQEAEARSKAWRDELQAYERKKAALPVRDYESAEQAAEAGLTDIQQTIIIKGADDPAKMIYALGKRPDLLAQVAAITDPVKFTIAIGKLEGKLNVTSTRRPPPEPESRPRGAAPLSVSNEDKQLAKLEEKAAKTGDRTEVVRYKRQLKEREQARRGR